MSNWAVIIQPCTEQRPQTWGKDRDYTNQQMSTTNKIGRCQRAGEFAKIEMIGDDSRDKDNRDLEDDKKPGPQRRNDAEVAMTDNDNNT